MQNFGYNFDQNFDQNFTTLITTQPKFRSEFRSEFLKQLTAKEINLELDECKENSVNQFFTLKEIANSVATYFDFILHFAFLIMKLEINTSVILSTKFCIIGLLNLKGHI